MPKLEDVLKAQGFTDADIAAAAPLMGDAKFRGAVEAYVGQKEQALADFRQENDRWADWAEKVNKFEVDGLKSQKLELVSRTGSLEARLKALDPTFQPGQPAERKVEPAGGDFDPSKHGLLTEKIFHERIKEYASAEGDAIAMANDYVMEYKRLTGSDMLDYNVRTKDGRELRGMSALLYESRSNGKNLPDYIEQKFDFAGKRAQATEAAKKASEDAIRKDERMKVMGEFGNPNTRQMMPSQHSLIPPPSAGENKQPWERGTPNDRRNSRLAKNIESQARSMVN